MKEQKNFLIIAMNEGKIENKTWDSYNAIRLIRLECDFLRKKIIFFKIFEF